MGEEKKVTELPMPHSVVMEDRKSLAITGVSDVDSFDEHTVVVYTDLGELVVRGDELHINRLSVELGELQLEGNIQALIYQAPQQKNSGGFFSKVFR